MNVFVLDLEPERCAEYHNDRHVVKMVTESAQILSTVCRLKHVYAGYKVTHQNHPCVKWCLESISNWFWLLRLCEALNEEWKYRYDHIRDHKAYSVAANLPFPPLPSNGLTTFAQAMPEQYRRVDIVEAYRTYYMNDKRHLASWKRRGEPEWWR